MFKEFKEFAIKGNVVDMAVGLIIGAGFGKIVTSLVNDIIMPPVGLLVGGINFSNFALVLKPASDGVAAVSLNYGLFINNTVDFIIVAFVMFLLVKQINKFKKIESDKKVADIKEEILLLREIRDGLKNITPQD